MSREREQLTSRFEDLQKKANHYGELCKDQNDIVHRTFNGLDYMEKIKECHREMKFVIEELQRLNIIEGLKPTKPLNNDIII